MGRFNLSIYDEPEIKKGIENVAKEESLSLAQAATKLVKEALRARGKLKETVQH